MAELVDAPLALLNLSTISLDSGESVTVVLREPGTWRSVFAAFPPDAALRVTDDDDETKALI
jgi:hypothetical protein